MDKSASRIAREFNWKIFMLKGMKRQIVFIMNEVFEGTYSGESKQTYLDVVDLRNEVENTFYTLETLLKKLRDYEIKETKPYKIKQKKPFDTRKSV